MATVTAFLKHTHISKQKQAEPYTAAAHARYVMRQNAVQVVYSEGMPKQYHAVQRFLEHHEDGLRKNGRVLDKFIISIPHDVSEDDAVKALRAFGHRLGHGKAPFLFALHGFDTRNHHAHFLFVDRDPDTGRRVFGTSEKNSSAIIKIEWETAANSTFEQLGYDVRVKVSDGYQEEVANDNASIRPDMQVADSEDEAEETGIETVSEEDYMADIRGTIPRPHEEDISSAADRVRHLHNTVSELNQLRDARQRILDTEAKLEHAITQKSEVEVLANDQAETARDHIQKAAAAQVALIPYQRNNGKLRGIGLNIFGWEYKTETRKRAEVVQREASHFSAEAETATDALASYRNRIKQLDYEQAKLAEELLMRRNEQLGVNGEMIDLEEAEQIHLATIQTAIDGEEGERKLDPSEVWQAWLHDEVTTDEIVEYCRQTGNVVLHAEVINALADTPEYSKYEGQSL